MIALQIDYASPSVFHADRDRALLGFSSNCRRPVRFHARVKDHIFLLRTGLQALGELVWSNDQWISSADFRAFLLDPVITVHPDRIFLEAFSQDQSAYGLLILDPSIFEPEGDVLCGTTNVDFTAWLWGALSEMRSSRQTWIRIGPEGFEVSTIGAGGRFEKKVQVPESWVRGFLQLQGAMAMPGTRIHCRPVDLLAAIRFLKYTKAKVSPRALRYEFEPDQDARIVLEPWEKVIPLRGADHTYTEMRSIRTWGRRRLRLLEPLLAYADSVEIYLKGRALPSVYAVHAGKITFVLGLSGWSDQSWTGAGSFDLAALEEENPTASHSAAALEELRKRTFISVNDLAQTLQIDRATADNVLTHLCKTGRAIYDVRSRNFRHRELFDQPQDERKLYPPDPRKTAARQFVVSRQVTIRVCQPRETRKIKRLKSVDGKVDREIVYREWQIVGTAGGEPEVEIIVTDVGRIIFGRCACPFFREHLLNQGPCEHMIALLADSQTLRKDMPASFAASRPEPAQESEEDGEEDEKS